jgi:hypothetical protein
LVRRAASGRWTVPSRIDYFRGGILALIEGVVRWAVVAIGVAGVLAAMTDHLLGYGLPRPLDRGIGRARAVVTVALCLLMAIGGLYRVSLAWYAALLFAVENLAEVGLETVRILDDHVTRTERWIVIVWSLVILLLLAALVSPPGRRALGL